MLTLDTSVVISGLAHGAMDIDTVGKKLYFCSGHGILRANFDGSRVEAVVQRAEPLVVMVDWEGRRIFWTSVVNNEISTATLNGKEKRVLRTAENQPCYLAVDPIEG